MKKIIFTDLHKIITNTKPMIEAMHHPLTQIEIIHRLKKVGFTQEQSEAQAQIITEVNEDSLATKLDVKNLEKKTDSEFTLLRKEIHSEFALIRKEMEALKLDLTVRMTFIMGSLLTLFSAIQKLF